MNIIITTVKRSVNYLDRCIESIRQDYDGDIILMIGGRDTAYTDKYQKGFKKCYIGLEEEDLKNSIQKAGYGYYRCLTYDKTQSALIFEDDIQFKRGWYTTFLSLLKNVKDEKYAISFNLPFRESVPQPDIKVSSLQAFLYNPLVIIDKPGAEPQISVLTYVNTSAIYYPASMLQTDLAEFIYAMSVEGEAVHDMPMGYYMFRMCIPIYIIIPALLNVVDSSVSAIGLPDKRSHGNYLAWDWTKYL